MALAAAIKSYANRVSIHIPYFTVPSRHRIKVPSIRGTSWRHIANTLVKKIFLRFGKYPSNLQPW